MFLHNKWAGPAGSEYAYLAGAAARYHDHSLSGNWKDHRDCHIKPDLVLIYQKPDTKTIRLVRLGSHSELGL